MPVHMRTSALVLLQDMKNEYIDLFCRNATIPFPVQRAANLYFEKNLVLTPIRPSCWSRPNYIKRTNIFFIFQDIIKNEIKRLSAELTPISYTGDETGYDMVVPSYYPHTPPIRQNTVPRYIGPQAIIEYKYDGPFIIIEVKDRAESAALVRQGERITKKRTFFGKEDADILDVPSRRERQMSFSYPERTIIQQMSSSCSPPSIQLRSPPQPHIESETHSIVSVEEEYQHP